TEQSLRILGEQELRETVAASKRQGTAACRPREAAFIKVDLLRLGLRLRETYPGHLRIRVRDGWNHTRIEIALVACAYFGRDAPFVARFVSEHGLTYDVTDRKNMLDVGPHLPVDRYVTALVDLDTR